jgi:hypothetical protein
MHVPPQKRRYGTTTDSTHKGSPTECCRCACPLRCRRQKLARSSVTGMVLGSFWGVDRFYLGYIGLGVIKLITCGGCGIWALIDFILIVAGVMRDAQGNELRRTPNDWIIVLVIVVATIVLNIFYGVFSIIAGMMQRGMPTFKPIP